MQPLLQTCETVQCSVVPSLNPGDGRDNQGCALVVLIFYLRVIPEVVPYVSANNLIYHGTGRFGVTLALHCISKYKGKT